MKKILAGVVLICALLQAFAGTSVYYVAKQEISSGQAVKSELFGNLINTPVYANVITNTNGTAEVYYKCGWSGTWVWADGQSSGTTQVPYGSLAQGTCYPFSQVPSIPELQLH